MSARLLVEEMQKIVEELDRPRPARIHINPKMWRAFRERLTSGKGSSLWGLEVHHNQLIETFAIEYSDGTFRVPDLEGA